MSKGPVNCKENSRVFFFKFILDRFNRAKGAHVVAAKVIQIREPQREVKFIGNSPRMPSWLDSNEEILHPMY